MVVALHDVRRHRPCHASWEEAMNTSIRFARRWILLACALTLVACTGPKSRRRPGPPIDIYLSAGDSWWIGTWLPVDSPGSIAASVALWADVFDIKRIYWRGQQEEMMIDHGLIRKENVRYHQLFNEWERYLMKDEKVNQVVVQEAHRRGVEVYLWAPLFDFGGPADNGGCAEFPYFGQINLTLKHPEWMPV